MWGGHGEPLRLRKGHPCSLEGWVESLLRFLCLCPQTLSCLSLVWDVY